MSIFTKLQMAQICHEVNKAYCEALGDTSQPSWENAPQWQKDSAMTGVLLHTDNPAAGPDDSHNSWLKQKTDEGWKYGPIKNPELKEHPCFVPYDELSKEQQAKDYIFRGIVHALNSIKGSDPLDRAIIDRAYETALDQPIRYQDRRMITVFANTLLKEFRRIDKDESLIVSEEDHSPIPVLEVHELTQEDLDASELYRLQMAGICTAAIGYWKIDDSIHPEYKTQALTDVANLYSKYDNQFKLNKLKEDLPLSITQEYIDSLCSDPEKIQYYLFPQTNHTICLITLPNGSTVTGESVCAANKIFNKELGEEYAFTNAKQKLWELEGYSLCEKRYQAGLAK